MTLLSTGKEGRILEPSALLVDNLDLIERVIRFTAYDHRLDPSDAEDFAGDVKLRLVENDYAVLRAFEDRSSFRTFISVVVQRMALDYRTRAWGRWRPSAKVQRLGELAIELDRLLHRDGRTLDEAVPLLRTKHEGVSRDSLATLAAKLPVHAPRPRNVPIEENATEHLARPPDVDDQVLAGERRRRSGKLAQVISAFIARLPHQDRLILRLRFQGEMSVAQIARAFALDQKATYRHIDQIHRELKGELARAGLTSRDVLDLIGHDEIFVHFDFGNQNSCQSMPDDEKTGPTTEER